MINGIKPKITTTTKLGIKPTSFDKAMEKFEKVLSVNARRVLRDLKNHLVDFVKSEQVL